MKKLLIALLPLTLCAAAAFGSEDEDSNVRWNSIVGVITLGWSLRIFSKFI